MRRLFRPTLARRILIAMLLAFVFSFIVIASFNYFQVFGDQNGELAVNRRAFAESVSRTLSGYETDAKARTAAEAIQRMIEARMGLNQRPAARIAVWAPDGRRVYASIELPDQRPRDLELAASNLNWNGQSYAFTSASSPRYIVDVLELSSNQLVYKKMIIQDFLGDLLVKMLIAFPLVLLVIWFAIHSGLRPLGTLSDTLRRRPVDDLTPLPSDMRYEELHPVVLAINDLLRRLKRKIQQEQSFVNDAAHELQTPLAVIANQTHVLAGATTIEERTDAYRNTELAIERAGHLVRQMLVLSRLDSDQQDVHETFDIAANVRELLALLVPVALARSIELSLESQDSVPFHGDPGALHSVVGNLVDNALRYIGDGGQICVEITSDDDIVRLRVLDDGPGIRIEDRERVFDRYYRVAGTGTPGSGLGLAIVKQATARMQGKITLTDGPNGRGCAFVVELPAGHTDCIFSKLA